MPSWTARLNPTPAFPDYTGPYRVGTVEVEVPHTALDGSIEPTVAFRCYYPCTSDAPNAAPVRWIPSPQASFVSAYARFLGAGSKLSQLLSIFPQLLYYITIPVTRNAPLLPAPTTSKQWPVMIFSHGLGGGKNAYSHICGSLASHGIVVIAPEHRDGSCPISYIRATETSPRHSIDYRRYSHKPSQEVYDGRDAQLRIRLRELDLIHSVLHQLNNGDHVNNLCTKAADLGMFRNALDIEAPGSVIFAGHSFGAATTVQLVKTTYYLSQDHTLKNPLLAPSSLLKKQITPATSTILLDLWALPLKSPNTSDLWAYPMPCFASASTSAATTPPLAILSAAFAAWATNLADTTAALRSPHADGPKAHVFYPLRSAHLSQSDFGVLFPTLARYLAKADEPARTIALNVRAALQVLRVKGVEVARGDLSGEEAAEADGDAEETEKREGWDAAILETREGAVRGWVAVEV